MTEIITITCGNANAYLLHSPEGGILIDTGTERYRDKVLNACHGRDVKLSNRVITSQRIPPVTPSVILTDGMSLRGYGMQGKALVMPGHTAGSVGVLLDTGELFVGDAMQNIGAPACAWCYEDREEAQRSVEVIRGIKAKAIYFGHGRPKVSR